MTRIISPIAIDLGAKYTGVFYSQYLKGEAVSAHNSAAATLVMPVDGEKMIFSQKTELAQDINYEAVTAIKSKAFNETRFKKN